MLDSYNFLCPCCQLELVAEKKLYETNVNCPGCQNVIFIPTPVDSIDKLQDTSNETLGNNNMPAYYCVFPNEIESALLLLNKLSPFDKNDFTSLLIETFSENISTYIEIQVKSMYFRNSTEEEVEFFRTTFAEVGREFVNKEYNQAFNIMQKNFSNDIDSPATLLFQTAILIIIGNNESAENYIKKSLSAIKHSIPTTIPMYTDLWLLRMALGQNDLVLKELAKETKMGEELSFAKLLKVSIILASFIYDNKFVLLEDAVENVMDIAYFQRIETLLGIFAFSQNYNFSDYFNQKLLKTLAKVYIKNKQILENEGNVLNSLYEEVENAYLDSGERDYISLETIAKNPTYWPLNEVIEEKISQIKEQNPIKRIDKINNIYLKMLEVHIRASEREFHEQTNKQNTLKNLLSKLI